MYAFGVVVFFTSDPFHLIFDLILAILLVG